MKRKQKKIMAFLASLVLSLGLCVQASAAEGGTADISIRVKYGQTEARSMLQMINDFRTGEDAWQLDTDNEKVSLVGKLGELTYDYNLEKIAMQRAAELAVSCFHTRPNGTDWDTLTVNGARTWAENIAAGYPSAEAVFKAWQETDEKYDGQGHRRSMLSANYKAVGIGHVSYGGKEFWVQEFGDKVSGSTATAANDSEQDVTVEVLKESLTADVSVNEKAKEMEFGATADVPSVTVTYKLGATWQSAENTFTPAWEVKDAAVASVADGKITAKAVGSTTLAASVEGKSLEVALTVTPASLENAEVTLDAKEYPYEGEEAAITPKPTVTAAGRTLVEGTDYSLAYADNTKPGTAKITVEGKGNYTGTVVKEFAIVCKHEFGEMTVTKKATCAEEGEESHTCKICGEVRTTVIPKLEHTVVKDSGKEATCTEEGLTEGSHCSVCETVLEAQEVIPAKGHVWDEGTVTEEATCAKAGSKEFTCTVCGEKRTEEIEKLPHTEEIDEAKAETCTKDGKTEGSHCSVCGEVLKAQETIPKTGHVWGEGKVTKESTHKEEGVKTFYCQKCGIKGIIILDKLEYQITKGAESTWKQGAKEGLTIVSDGDLADFVNVKVDGKVVDKKWYEIKSGSTIVTLKQEYLSTLSPGTHTYCVQYTDGSVETTFTIKENASAPAKKNEKQTKTVKTGDTAPTTLLIGLMLFAICGAAVGVKMKKRG